MKKQIVTKKILMLAGLLLAFCCAEKSFSEVVQTEEIRQCCKDAQKLEHEISNLSQELDNVQKMEMTSLPVIKDICEVLSVYFTVLLNIQRFSPMLALIQEDNKNDFVRCSIIIKNLTAYFNQVRDKLNKEGVKVLNLEKRKKEINEKISEKKSSYKKINEKIQNIASDLSKNRQENIIQNDVVYHLASKSESLEELDAELEAEQTVGVIRNTKFYSNLVLSYPVYGRIVTEFGDRGPTGEMIYCLSLETVPGAIVTSPCEGVVVFSGKFLDYGNMVIISNGDYRVFLYGMDFVFAVTGDILRRGDFIGKMAENFASKPIIKIELKKSGEPLDPRHWMQEFMENERGHL